MWLDENTPGPDEANNQMGKSFASKVVIVSSPIAEPLSAKKTLLADGGGVKPSSPTNPNFARIAPHTGGTQISGIYEMTDDYGTSYYYRGAKDELNNNLVFGGFQWKIIRINGDGSIRIIYNGICQDNDCAGAINDTGTSTQIGTYAWNTTKFEDSKYLGYMYGGANGVVSTCRNGIDCEDKIDATLNETSSNAKIQLETWYANNILGNLFEDKIVDRVFCNDRRLQSDVGGEVTGNGFGSMGNTYYASYQRLGNTKNPDLTCPIKNDAFTQSETPTTNGNLTYPIGLITADEVSLAGGLIALVNTENSLYYLYTNETYWTMSPRANNSGNARMYHINPAGSLQDNAVISSFGLRPVLNLASDIEISGDGSTSNPYVVISD